MKQPVEKNAFNLPILDIKDVLEDSEIEAVIQSMRQDVFRYLGIEDNISEAVMAECLEWAHSCDNEQEYERCAHEALKRVGFTDAIPAKLEERAHIIYEQLKSHLSPGSVLDLGCGDARVAQLLGQDGFVLQLADVYEHTHVADTKLPFILLGQSDALPFDNDQFDSTLLITVLHHSDNPIQVIREACRITRSGGTILVIESVYGVDGKALTDKERAKATEYLSLSPEQQRRINIFFDHFYNRVIHFSEDPTTKVNVPFNFNTPQIWKILFEQNGMNESEVIHLGTDQPLVPEYHTLHILTVN